jgi:hypothetical protein
MRNPNPVPARRELGILGFVGTTLRQIVLLDRQRLAGLDRQN